MHNKYNVYLDAPNLNGREREYIYESIKLNYVSTIGPFVEEFENRFAKYIGSKKAVSVQSGTAALHLALYESGIGEGDEVIVPSLTFVATINPILYVGATPVIVDVDPETWTIDPNEIEKAITPRTKAVIPVHLYGNPCNLDDIVRIAEKYNIYIIEDAAESLGASFKGKQTGTFGSFGCFSFNGNKLITTGGGGMVVTDDIKKAEHIKFLVNQARDSRKGYYHPEMGFNYRMTNLEASLGLAQLERIDEFLEKKISFRRIYMEILGDLSYVTFQKEPEGAKGSWWLNCIKIEKEINLFRLVDKLKKDGIPTRPVFVPACKMPYLKKYSRSCLNALNIYNRGICLPSSTLNTIDTIREIAVIIRREIEWLVKK